MNNPLNLYSRYIKDRYGQRVQKIPVDAGFTCPNRDGSKGYGGCTFCNNDSFSMGVKELSIKEQVQNGIDLYRRKFPKLEKFIVYFQSYSNTYKSVSELEKLYLEALNFEGVVGIAIGTRPDCIDKEKVALLKQLAQNYDVTVEYGVESLSDETLKRVNRGHSVKDFEVALDMTYGRGIKLCTHLILGFPWESEADLQRTCYKIQTYPLDFIKIHQLQIVKGTIMGAEFEKAPFPVIKKEEYFRMLMEVITHLDPKIVIQRLFSDYRAEYLISKPWGESMSQLMNEFMRYLEFHQAFQGSKRT